VEHLGRVLKRRSVIALVSDFLDMNDKTRGLSALSRRHRVNGFLLSDPLEEAVGDVGLLTIEDQETGERRLVDSRKITTARPILERRDLLRQCGLHTTSISTAEDPFRALQRHFHRLERSR